MIRNETRDPSGTVLAAEVIDLATNTITLEEHGAVVLVRDLTYAERAAIAMSANVTTIEDKVRAALTANTAYLAIAAPTNAQNTAQVKALTRQMNAIIRRTIGADLLADTTGT